MQDFEDFELIVIDDCSADETRDVMASFDDPRIRYIRNKENVGSKHGDRAHIKRFVYELARGKYHLYLCDDDYWLPKDLLSRQVGAFLKHPDTVMVIGGQLSYFLVEDEEMPAIDRSNLREWIDEDKTSLCEKISYHKGVYENSFMTSEVFLRHFSADPTTCNIIVGATLYDRNKFIESEALKSEVGSKWQAGYELLMGPGCYGAVVYIDEPCILCEIRDTNASFRRTQLEHYLDSILSIELAFAPPMRQTLDKDRRRFLKALKREGIRNITYRFLRNAETILNTGQLGMCSEENISRPVLPRDMFTIFVRNRIWPNCRDTNVILHIIFHKPLSARRWLIHSLKDKMRHSELFIRCWRRVCRLGR